MLFPATAKYFKCKYKGGKLMKKLIFDIGATNTKFAVMHTDGGMDVKKKVPTDYDSIESFFTNITQIVKQYGQNCDEIAISTNGRMDSTGNVYRAYIPKILAGVNLKREVEQRTGIPTTIINDGFSAALGEWWRGAGHGSSNLLVLVLGSGLGGGLILNGELYEGKRRNAAMVFGMLSSYGKLGYDLNGRPTSFMGILNQLSALKKIPMDEMTGQLLFELAEKGDSDVLEMLNLYCENIAGLIINTTLLLDLEKTIVTGGLSEQKILMTMIQSKINDILQEALRTSDIIDMACGDRKDYNIHVQHGSLSLDANLYGALYHLLHKK